MGIAQSLWTDPLEFLRTHSPTDPVLFFSPAALHHRAQRFLEGFEGLVTYAVKANPSEAAITNLAAAGVMAFDVASPVEIALVRRLVPNATLHYNNPVRADFEITAAITHDVASYSVDSHSELDKLIAQVPVTRADGSTTEITARFKLPVSGAAYDFGTKFGATVALAAELLQRIAKAGFTPSLTFHPGTQCPDPKAWESYIHAAKDIVDTAGIKIARLNVGGGFPSHRLEAHSPALEVIFAKIAQTAREAFGPDLPQLVCEPGRGLVADAYALLTRVKSLRDDTHVFLNDGLYGAMNELPQLGPPDRLRVWAPGGQERSAAPRERLVFGPTCDSLDHFPDPLNLPGDLAEGDFVLFQGMGAYSVPTNSRFNGFGALDHHLAMALEP